MNEYLTAEEIVDKVFKKHSLPATPHVKHVSESPAPEAVTPLHVAASIARASAGRF